MDTAATSHMTHSQGTLINYFPFKHHHNNHIIVGDGNLILVHGHGDLPISSSNPSLTLKNVVHAPTRIKNLIYIRMFTHNNNVSVEFDPFGFSVKELGTGTILLQSNSHGDLYPFTPSIRASFSHHHLHWPALLYLLLFGILAWDIRATLLCILFVVLSLLIVLKLDYCVILVLWANMLNCLLLLLCLLIHVRLI